jgi:acyl dehydratase
MAIEVLRYRVQAYNTATASTNKIHDDAVARQYGFRGGLVPGVDVYAYLCHLPAERWGADWLARGTMTARFRSPVYDGETVEVEGTVTDDDGVDLALHGPSGELCAGGRATLPEPAAVPDPPDPSSWPAGEPPVDRPPASAASLRARPFGQLVEVFDAAAALSYLDDVREDLPLFADRGLAHPAWLLRYANYVLGANVQLGPWIHTASTVQLHGPVGDGAVLETRALVADVRDQRGHQVVDLDVLQLASGQVVARTTHTAIYQLRDTPPRAAGPASSGSKG